MRTLSLVLALTLAGCGGGDSAGSGSGPVRAARALILPERVPQTTDAAPSDVDIWKADRNPWTGFAPGSWAQYRLSDGTIERWTLIAVDGGTVRLGLQVRKSAKADWERSLMRISRDAGAWPLVAQLGPAVKRTSVTVGKKGQPGALSATRVEADRRTLLVSAQVPGGLVSDSHAQGDKTITDRQLLAFGAARK